MPPLQDPREHPARCDLASAQYANLETGSCAEVPVVQERPIRAASSHDQADPMYGPAVRCKWFRRADGERSCINVSGL
jgi:hypothetical protein